MKKEKLFYDLFTFRVSTLLRLILYFVSGKGIIDARLTTARDGC